MYVRNLLRPGECVSLVPLGIPVVLVYNHDLDRVWLNYDGQSHEDVTDKFKSILQKRKDVPNKINIVTGTTWVYGVLYTNHEFSCQGILPDSALSNMVDYFLDNPQQFSFFAGYVKSNGSSFAGAMPIRQWLVSSGFNCLPGLIVSANVNRDNFYTQVRDVAQNFKFPLFMNYIIYSHSEVSIMSTKLYSIICRNISKYVDENGCLIGQIETEDNTIMKFKYSDIFNNNIEVGDSIILDSYGHMIYVLNKGEYKDKQCSIVCPVCHKQYVVGSGDSVICDDINCLSRVYSRFKQFTSCLGLQCPSYDEVQSMIKNHKIVGFIDIVDLINDVDHREPIRLTISKLLRAIIPIEIVRDDAWIDKFCNNCNNSWEVIQYYINNPQKMISDGVINNNMDDSVRAIEFFKDSMNIQDIEWLHDYNGFVFEGNNCKFDGPPIFRNKTLMLSGKFNHGSYSEIASILRSYGCNVVYKFNDNIDGLLVGDIKEDIDGVSIRKCHNLHIPILDEGTFFENYGIDEDLADNLQ